MDNTYFHELKLSFLSENIDAYLTRCKKNPTSALEWWLSEELRERHAKRLDARKKTARLGLFKTMSEFDWDWPSAFDQAALKHVLSAEFFKGMKNVLIVGPEGLGKTMLAKNIALSAIEHGHRALFVSASAMIGDLNSQKDGHHRMRALRRYTSPNLLVIDEIGYVTYSQESAFNLFEVVIPIT